MRVLIVDDNQDQAKTLAAFVSLLGYEARFVVNPRAALGTASDFRPDFLFLDIGMPEIDGYELARLMREQLGKHARIVAITGYGTEDAIIKAKAAGFDSHLIKPPDLRILEEMLKLAADQLKAR